MPTPITAQPGDTLAPPAIEPEPLDYKIEWTELGGNVDEARLVVPLDYVDPQGETIELYVTRHRADPNDRIGSLLVNNGGPGSPASTMGVNATSWFLPAITERFDVVGWDPRGTGASGGAVDCIDDAEYDEFFAVGDITPEDASDKADLVRLAEEFATRCQERVGRALQYIGTNNSARDMDAIRQALGEEQVSYFGFSYGSELGAVWATLFPTTVRAAVFDGAADPNADSTESTLQQWIGFENSLNTFLAECSATTSCAFHNDGDAESAFDALFVQLDESPIPGPEGRADVNLGVAVTGVVRAMYSDRFWPALERSLDEAQSGDIFEALGIGRAANHMLGDDNPVSNVGYPVVAKIVSPDIAHKTEASGVILNIQNDEELKIVSKSLRARIAKSHPNAHIEGILVQRMEQGLAEVLVGYRGSSETGPIITLALGGTLAEIYNDASVRLAPVNKASALEMIEEVKGLAPIRGYRGMPKGDLEALAEAIMNLSALAASSKISEAEINPLIVKGEGEGVVAVDGLIILYN